MQLVKFELARMWVFLFLLSLKDRMSMTLRGVEGQSKALVGFRCWEMLDMDTKNGIKIVKLFQTWWWF